tara:strand:- start:32 stop:355 length:324 start_codon:yes stop_codon:yes gene_type:complete
MKFRFIKIITILFSFFFLTGFLPFVSILGPSLTAFTSGNIYKAGAQYMVNKTIKDTTGKNSLTYVKDKIDKNNDNKNLNRELKELVEKRIQLTRAKLNFEKLSIDNF